MRIFALATLIIATLAAAAPARAQTYDPAYPVCMHVYGRIVYYDCRFSSISQCKASASGRGAQARGCGELQPLGRSGLLAGRGGAGGAAGRRTRRRGSCRARRDERASCQAD